MATALHVYSTAPMVEQRKSGAQVRVSSGWKYDDGLLAAFPHFIYVSFDDARKLTDIIEAGIRGKLGLNGVGSYASTVDFRTGGKVLWLSDSSYTTLRVWLDPEEYSITDVPAHMLYNGAPTHLVGGE